MIYASLFSGIEAASVAWQPLGWQAAFFAEIEKFPARILEHHYPDVPNYGDITKFKNWPQHATIDLIVGGSPCQSFSIAGLRRGLADPRGNLIFAYLGVVAKYRPRWLVWENVPGALSVDDGRAFTSFLCGLEELGYHAAWRVLDAQYTRTQLFPHAVPQRRRRLFLVGYFGDWRYPAQVLFERESLSRSPAPRREARQKTSPQSLYRFVSFGEYAHTDTASTIKARDGKDATDLIVFDSCVIKTANTKANGSNISYEGAAYTLDSQPNQAVFTQPYICRFTPLESERLMGFPDNYTALPKATDSARYRALGNSMAVNCMHWLGERIAQVEKSITKEEVA